MERMVDRDRLIPIGRVLEPHGKNGSLKVLPLTDSPSYYETCREIYIDSEEGLRRHAVKSLAVAAAGWILSVDEVTGRDGANTLRGAEVLVPEASLRPLETDEYFRHDLVGCTVETMAGKTLGRVREVMMGTAQHLLVVCSGASEVLLPLVSEIVRDVDTENQVIRVEPPPGLLELNG